MMHAAWVYSSLIFTLSRINSFVYNHTTTRISKLTISKALRFIFCRLDHIMAEAQSKMLLCCLLTLNYDYNTTCALFSDKRKLEDTKKRKRLYTLPTRLYFYICYQSKRQATRQEVNLTNIIVVKKKKRWWKYPLLTTTAVVLVKGRKKNGDGVEIGMCGVLIFVVLFLCWFSSECWFVVRSFRWMSSDYHYCCLVFLCGSSSSCIVWLIITGLMWSSWFLFMASCTKDIFLRL